jgi:uridine kinase
LVVAVAECLDGAKITVDHSMPTGAFYCWIEKQRNLSPEKLVAIKQKMVEIIEANDPIVRENIPLDQVREIFAKRGDDDKLRLLEVRDKDYLSVYTLRGYIDYFFGYMAPSTGYIHQFDLIPVKGGLALCFPVSHEPDKIQPYVDSPKLFRVFRRTSEWLKLIDIQDIGQLNRTLKDEDQTREMVLVAEALHERRISRIAERIAKRHQKGGRIVLIAGPSSSGKTTFSKRLAIQLMTHGIKPFTLEMDNYFVDRELTPRDEFGDYDFESFDALNVEKLNADLLTLIQGKTVVLPKFDFKVGRSIPDKEIKLSPDHIIILEGIHGMNPNLTPEIPLKSTFRIYISALTQLNIDRHNRVPTTDVRLIRRIVRDATYRGYEAEATLSRWHSVRRGEEKNIFPYQENADALFNSSLVYELAVLRSLAEPLLRRVSIDSPLQVEVNRLLSFLRWVRSINEQLVPDNSILREFIGGSILRDYHPGA